MERVSQICASHHVTPEAANLLHSSSYNGPGSCNG
ncbi:hypothetical protein V6N11_011867 [Hibiscus sabdariffa]|uniref:Uncharacterized protein n=1 Tax=Hibiscus sabdariffa TaxID=183260 RepID=A0ABR2SAE2_9ROSI